MRPIFDMEWAQLENEQANKTTKGLMAWILIVMGALALILSVRSCAWADEINMDAIKQIESSGNPKAWNKHDDSRGLYQITPVCLKEFNNFHPQSQYTANDLWIPEINYKIAHWYLNVRVPQMLKHYKKPVTISNQIIAFNAGISYALNSRELPNTTKQYLVKYARLTK